MLLGLNELRTVNLWWWLQFFSATRLQYKMVRKPVWPSVGGWMFEPLGFLERHFELQRSGLSDVKVHFVSGGNLRLDTEWSPTESNRPRTFHNINNSPESIMCQTMSASFILKPGKNYYTEKMKELRLSTTFFPPTWSQVVNTGEKIMSLRAFRSKIPSTVNVFCSCILYKSCAECATFLL